MAAMLNLAHLSDDVITNATSQQLLRLRLLEVRTTATLWCGVYIEMYFLPALSFERGVLHARPARLRNHTAIKWTLCALSRKLHVQAILLTSQEI